MHKEDCENTECNKDTVGEWYSEKVFYGIKDMITLSSSAIRGVAKLSMSMEDLYWPAIIPPRLYLNSGRYE